MSMKGIRDFNITTKYKEKIRIRPSRMRIGKRRYRYFFAQKKPKTGEYLSDIVIDARNLVEAKKKLKKHRKLGLPVQY